MKMSDMLNTNREGMEQMRPLQAFAVLVALTLCALLAIGCDDDIPTGSTTPAAESAGDAELDIVSRLAGNAERFAYSVGEYGGTLTYATSYQPLTFNLALANDFGSSTVLNYLFEGLTEISWLTGEPEPNLAESWNVSSDGLTWTFNLRRDVRWHDGEPFTARDVEFTFNQIIYNDEVDTADRATFNFRMLNAQGEWLEAPMVVTAIDDYTVQCVLPVAFAPFLRAMSQPIFPRHVLQPHVETGTFAEVWSIDSDPVEVIGTGPFMIESYELAERVRFVRNADYWLRDREGNRLPYLDGIVQVIVPSREAVFDAFVDGASDIHELLGVEFAELDALQEDGDFTIHRRGPSFDSTFLLFNQHLGTDPESGAPYVSAERSYWFTNVEFRRAVAHAIDKDAIVQEVQHGLGYAQWASISPAAGDFHNPDVDTYEYNLDQANAILDDLGWTDRDGNGFREDDRGNEIRFTLATNIDNDERVQVTTIIHEGMLALGLNVTFEQPEFGQLVNQLVTTFDWEAIVIGFGGAPDPHEGIVLWHSNESLHLWYPSQTEPATAWEAELDDLYVRASQELDRARRTSLYRRAQEIVAEQVPVIFTSHPERLNAVRNVYGNVTPTLYGLWDVRYLYRTD